MPQLGLQSRGKVKMGGMQYLVVFLCLPFLLLGCQPSGDQVGDITSPTSPSAQVEQQAIGNVLDLYREALVNEDIDRLQSLLAPDVTDSIPQTRASTPPADFLQTIRDTLRNRTILSHTLQDVSISDDRQSATFLEVLSSLDPESVVQQTEVFRTTFTFIRQQEGEVVHFRIAGVARDGCVAGDRHAG